MFGTLEDVDGHGLYVEPAEVTAVQDFSDSTIEKDQQFIEAGFKSIVMFRYGHVLSKGTAADVAAKLNELKR